MEVGPQHHSIHNSLALGLSGLQGSYTSGPARPIMLGPLVARTSCHRDPQSMTQNDSANKGPLARTPDLKSFSFIIVYIEVLGAHTSNATKRRTKGQGPILGAIL